MIKFSKLKKSKNISKTRSNLINSNATHALTNYKPSVIHQLSHKFVSTLQNYETPARMIPPYYVFQKEKEQSPDFNIYEAFGYLNQFTKVRKDSANVTIEARSNEQGRKDIRKYLKKLQLGRAFRERLAVERERTDQTLEFVNRGWHKPNFVESLHIMGYASVSPIYGDRANIDPLRHLEYDVVQPHMGFMYKYISLDRQRTLLNLHGTSSNAAMVKVSASSLNLMDYWISQGVAHRLFEYRRNVMARFWAAPLAYRNLRQNKAYEDEESDIRDLKTMIRPEIGPDNNMVKNRVMHNDGGKTVWKDRRFPLTLGREFCGTLVDCGFGFSTADVGDRVWGVKAPFRYGACADHVSVFESHCVKAPDNLSDVELSCIPFAAVLTLNTIQNVIDEETTSGKNVLLIGAAGNVGSIATQILKAWGANILVLVSTKSYLHIQKYPHLAEKIDKFYLYDDSPETRKNPLKQISNQVDIIFNASTDENEMYKYENVIPKIKEFGWYLTINNTLYERADTISTAIAVINADADHTKRRKFFQKHNRFMKMANFNDVFASIELQRLDKMINEGKLRPIIYRETDVSNGVEAFREFIEGQKGKIVLTFKGK